MDKQKRNGFPEGELFSIGIMLHYGDIVIKRIFFMCMIQILEERLKNIS
jgi:hypothetical protein